MRVSQTDTGTQIAAQGLSDGAWKGTFNFTITKKTKLEAAASSRAMWYIFNVSQLGKRHLHLHFFLYPYIHFLNIYKFPFSLFINNRFSSIILLWKIKEKTIKVMNIIHHPI